MSIRSDILSLAPYLYWPLDDPSGPAASDASGNGRAGAYGGGFSLLQNGPESGTYCAQLGATGFVSVALPFSPLLAHSYAMWISVPAYVGGIQDVAGLGLTGTNGTSIQTSANVANYNGGLYGAAGGLGVGGAAIPLWNRYWHHVCITYNPTGTAGIFYLDGSNTGTASRLPRTAGGDLFYVRAPMQAVVCHVALFNYVLTGIQVALMSNHLPQWPFGPAPTNQFGLATSDVNVTNMLSSDAAVLAAVRHTF